MSEKGTLLVFSGPAGAGKDTVLELYLKKKPNKVWKSVSCTTRERRKGEVNGRDYSFITKEKFEQLIRSDSMLEYAKYGLAYYGTPKAPVDEHLKNGETVILKIEVQGAEQIKRLYPDSVGVFIMPPSIEILEQRLRDRGTESEEEIRRRLEIAKKEIAYSKNYDYHIVNDELKTAVDDLKAVIRAQQLKNK